MKLEYLSQEQCLKEYIKIATSINPTLSIEVGAHEAEYSNAMSIRGIRSIAFEASPAVYKKYKNYINNFEYINLAITNYAGSIFFNLDSAYNPSDIGHNSIKDFNLHWRSNGDPIKVSCSSLDLYFNNLQDEKICLWVDVEGANKEVLTGAIKLLKQVQTIYIEVEHIDYWVDQWKRQDVIDFLSIHGFKLYREFVAYQDQTNCIFIRK
jgi:FkbM family methyltransferase